MQNEFAINEIQFVKNEIQLVAISNQFVKSEYENDFGKLFKSICQ